MPKRKPDTVTRIEFALNRTDREVIERYLFFEKADRVSESLSQVFTVLTSTDGGILATWFLLDMIDDWAIPGDGILDYTMGIIGASASGDIIPPTPLELALKYLFGGKPGYAEEVKEYAKAVRLAWNETTPEQRALAAPFRKKINDYAKAGKWLIAGYFVMVHGDDWLTAISGLLPSTEGLGALFAL